MYISKYFFFAHRVQTQPNNRDRLSVAELESQKTEAAPQKDVLPPSGSSGAPCVGLSGMSLLSESLTW